MAAVNIETSIKSGGQSSTADDMSRNDDEYQVTNDVGHEDNDHDHTQRVAYGESHDVTLETNDEVHEIKVETNDGGDDNNEETGDCSIDPNNAQSVRVNNEDDDASKSNDGNNNGTRAITNEKTNLIVNYLPQQMTDEEFEELFKKFGSMKSCKIVRNRSTGYSYGFGFVDFETHEQAMKAIDDLNGHELENKKIKVAFARPAGQDIKQANLYIKNVPSNWTQDDVRRVFEPFGKIIQARVLGNNRNIAFVLFDLRKQAEDALEAMNGKKLDECEAPFEIKFAAEKKVDGGGGGGGGGAGGGNSNSSAGGGGGGKTGRRERGHRGGRNRNRDSSKQRSGSQSGGGRQGGTNQRSTSSSSGGSFFDRQPDRRGGQSNNNTSYYGNSNTQIPYNNNNNNNNNNNMNNSGFGPIRQQPSKMNRYAPFVAQQQQQPQMSTGAMAMPTQLAPPAAFGYPQQQQQHQSVMPTYMMAAGQPTMMQPMAQQQQQHHPAMTQAAASHPSMQMTMSAYQLPVSMGGVAHQMPTMGGYAPVTQDAMNNIYSVASNTMQNAAQLQPQLGQPMSMRHQHQSNNHNNSSSSTGDDGITLFVYNIGPNFNEDELRQMFVTYGQVVKCNVVRKTPGGETKGFGFVTLKTKDQANSAIAGLNGSTKFGRTLQVSMKK